MSPHFGLKFGSTSFLSRRRSMRGEPHHWASTRLNSHDESVRDLKGVPKQLVTSCDWMISQATTLFDAMGEDFGQFFRMMNACDLLDLKSRPGKAGGGFCADIPRYGVPFIFANFNGTQDDVNVFTHECGHAFQNWSSRDQSLLIYHWPTYEAADSLHVARVPELPPHAHVL